jgi:hypothetical protein
VLGWRREPWPVTAYRCRLPWASPRQPAP